MKRQTGDRIGAIRNADSATVFLFGFGTYQGDHVPPDDVMGPFARLGLYGISNPKLVMDDGTVVWGCECWWGDEDGCRRMIQNRQIVAVTPTRTPVTDAERLEALELMREAKAIAEPIVDEMLKGERPK